MASPAGGRRYSKRAAQAASRASVCETLKTAYGVAGLALARSWDGARTYFIGGGLIYLALWIYGIAIDLESGANFIGVNTAGNWLHFTLGVAMVGLGVALGRSRARNRIATT